jgi:hypothetical protein
LKKPDFATVLLVARVLVLLAVLTFELWMPHHWSTRHAISQVWATTILMTLTVALRVTFAQSPSP